MGSFKGLLKVAAPELRSFRPSSCGRRDLDIAAPKLSEVHWISPCYDPARHRFVGSGRHLRRLVTSTSIGHAAVALMRRFDIVDELNFDVYISEVHLPHHILAR